MFGMILIAGTFDFCCLTEVFYYETPARKVSLIYYFSWEVTLRLIIVVLIAPLLVVILPQLAIINLLVALIHLLAVIHIIVNLPVTGPALNPGLPLILK